MRKTNRVVFVFLGLVLGWVASATSSPGPETSRPDLAIDDAAPQQTDPASRKSGAGRELVFKEAPTTGATNEPSHCTAQFELVFRYPDYSDVSADIRTVNTKRLRTLPAELGAIVNQITAEKPNPYVKPGPKKVEHWLRTLAGRIEEKFRPSDDIVEISITTDTGKAEPVDSPERPWWM